MLNAEAVRRILRESPVPLEAGLIADLVGGDVGDVEQILARLEREGVAHQQQEWSLA